MVLPTFIACALAASVRYNVPADALLAVYSVEDGRAYTWSHDGNGTWDVGPLQFNTGYLASLKRWGISPRDVEGHSCYPWFLASWRIHDQLVDGHGSFWTRVAEYHSYSPAQIAPYRAHLIRYAARWRAWLVEHYPTVTVARDTQTRGGEARGH